MTEFNLSKIMDRINLGNHLFRESYRNPQRITGEILGGISSRNSEAIIAGIPRETLLDMKFSNNLWRNHRRYLKGSLDKSLEVHLVELQDKSREAFHEELQSKFLN